MTHDASTSRDVVLTVLHRANFNSIAPFVYSLKNAGFRGSIVLFASQVDNECMGKLRGDGVIVVPFHFSGKRDRQRLARLWPIWRWLFSTRLRPAAKHRLAHHVFHLRYRRYLLYSEFLEQRAADFDRVLLADGSDVFFQADPFAWDWKPGVHFFLEEPIQKIGLCRLHRLWLGCQFGQSFVEQNAQRTPSCSGTTFGDIQSIRQYLDAMIATIMRARNLAKISGGDQGIHNYVLIENLIHNKTVHDNRNGPVLTMGFMDDSDLQTDASGAALNDDGSLVPVLHQYNRLPGLKAHLLNSLQKTGPVKASHA